MKKETKARKKTENEAKICVIKTHTHTCTHV